MTRHASTLILITALHAVLFMGAFTLVYRYDGSGCTLAEAANRAATLTFFTGIFHAIAWHYILKKMAKDNKPAA